MADGDTTATPGKSEGGTQGASQQSGETVETLKAQLASVSQERDTWKDRHSNAERKIQEQGAELGELRKTARSPQDGQKAETTAKSTAQVPAAKESSLEEIEASLTPAEKTAAEEAYKRETDLARKRQIRFEPETRKRFLEIAKEAAAKKTVAGPVPDSLFDEPVAKNKTGSDDASLRKLFGLTADQGRYVPGGPGASTQSGSAGATSPVRQGSGVGGQGLLEACKRRRGSTG